MHTMDSFFQSALFTPAQFPLFVHKDRLSVNYTVLTHWHEEVEILYFISGEAKAICNQKVLHCHPGDVLFIGSFTFHSLERIVETCEYHTLSVGLEMFRTFGTVSDGMPAFCLTSDAQVVRAIDAVVNEFCSRDTDYQAVVEAQLVTAYAYIRRLARDLPDSIATKRQVNQFSNIRLVLDYINDHFTEKITMNELCQIARLSPSRFSTVFKNYTGRSVVDHINLMRCQYARTLFLTGNYSVTECAERAGYNNMPYFARKFRQIFGETLSQTKADDHSKLLR